MKSHAPKSQAAKNLVIAMALGGAALLAANRWLVPALFDLRPIRDGSASYADDDARLRLAAWQSPAPLWPALDTPQHESHVRTSTDGRWIVFSAGGAGQGELFLAEVVGGVASQPRALVELNSSADDVAPAWGPDGLYFASDRADGAGGLDLYRASFDGAFFGAVEPVAGVNTAAAETEPAPGHGELYFASDRGGAGFDLFVANAGATKLATELSSEADDRDPFVTADGRTLYFASDRHLGGGDFDLHRSFLDGGQWLASERLAGLDSRASERAPATLRDGLTLHFVREGSPEAELWEAKTIELFRGAEPARGWADLLLIAALLLLAVVAALSKRWEELDLLYKCALASVLLHLLILALLRYLYPDGEPRETPKREQRMRVRLEEPRERLRGLVERGGELEQRRETRPEREAPSLELPELAQLAPELAAPQAQPLESEARDEEAAPQRRTEELERTETPQVAAPELATPNEARERRSLAANDAAAPTPTEVARAASAQAAAGPERLETAAATPSASSAAPSAAPLAATTRQETTELPRTSAGSSVERPEPSQAHSAPQVAQPNESRARVELGSEGPAPAVAREFAPSRGEAAANAGPQRGELPDAPATTFELAAPSAGSLARSDAAPAPDAPSRAAIASERSASPGSSSASPTIELPSEARGVASLEAPRGSDAPQPSAFESRREGARTSAPERAEFSGRHAPIASSPLPAAAPLAAAPQPAAEDLPRSPRKLDDTPYRSRFGAEKEIALREHGGSQETERAVANGLRYLASRQRRDGAWGALDDRSDKYRDVRVGKTGLALLAFLGAGHVPGGTTEHAAVVERAVRWLVAQQDAASGHFGDSEAYGHGIATYALAECFALTRDPALREPIERAVERILSEQFTAGDARNVGGWSYFYADGAVFDRWPRASITAWQVMALESARLGGIAVPDEAFDSAHTFLRGAWDADLGRFRYSHDPVRLRSGYATLPGSTPAALFALSLLGEDLASGQWAEAVDFIGACAPDAYRWEGEDAFVERAAGNLYFWYYGSLALLRRGGDAWERWNVALKESLPPAQAPDGSWAPLDVYARYAGDDERDRVYSTAMCVLSLEVYYRYFTPLLRVR
ncbi:MAG: hypothetical protein NTV21_16275 [Planctomycetota bacterium]|nr:hypothetical protein [Planctomycetota bacterium]